MFLLQRMILNAIEKFCIYLKVAMCTTDSEARSLRQSVGLIWPISHGSHDVFKSWLPQCLRYTRITYATLISLDLPSSALDIVQKFIDDTRLHCFSNIFEKATQNCNKLTELETWEMGVEDFPGATLLPQLLENLLIETLEEAQQSCINPEMRFTSCVIQAFKISLKIFFIFREGNLLESESDGQREVSLRLQQLLLCFCNVIQELAFNYHKEETPTHNVSQLLGYPNNQLSGPASGRFASLSSSTSTAITWEQRMLCCLANCAYCNKSFFHKVGKLFEK